MRLLTSGVITTELLAAANEAWWDHPLSKLALAAVISGGVLLFIVKRIVGRRRPHKVTVADYWWRRDDGVLVTDSVPNPYGGRGAKQSRRGFPELLEASDMTIDDVRARVDCRRYLASLDRRTATEVTS
jgi:hypothetical protein